MQGLIVAETKTADKRSGKLWRGPGRFGSLSALPMGSELPRTGSGRRRRVLSPPLGGSTSNIAPSGERVNGASAGGTGGQGGGAGVPTANGTANHHQGRWRAPGLRLGTTRSLEDPTTAHGGGGEGGDDSTGARSAHQESDLAPDRGDVVGADGGGGGGGGENAKTRRAWGRASEPTVVAQTLSPTRRSQATWLDSGEEGERVTPKTGRGRSLEGVPIDVHCDAKGGASSDIEGAEDRDYETVAKPPPWMEGVAASAKYEEMKPALDVIKRTVLLAVLQQVRLLPLAVRPVVLLVRVSFNILFCFTPSNRFACKAK